MERIILQSAKTYRTLTTLRWERFGERRFVEVSGCRSAGILA